uniref:Uncharacterized protein n=1 Tax=Anguilla anguilla TaxID=7936 RepID=A0A0E9SHS4_ANGAN
MPSPICLVLDCKFSISDASQGFSHSCILKGLAPDYLTELLIPYSPPRLRSQDAGYVKIP